MTTAGSSHHTQGAVDAEIRTVHVSQRGASRWTERLHPWIYRSDVRDPPGPSPGTVDVVDERGRPIGTALWSPSSTISLRMLTHVPRVIDAAFWSERIDTAVAFRESLGIDATAYRLVHAEGDAMPSLIVDRYGGVLVAQFLSAGIEAHRSQIVAALEQSVQPAGIIARDDVPIRRHEQLTGDATLLAGKAPRTVEVREGNLRWLASPWSGQKTGAFLDQRVNRVRATDFARGRALDCFTYHGAFALHLARGGADVIAIDSSAEALEHATHNARLNGIEHAITFLEANVFDALRDFEERGERFDVIVLDPPAFAKKRDAVEAAIRGYKEINLRALRLLSPGGHLLTFSCSYHLSAARFRSMLESAAIDARRPVRWIEWRGQAPDHPEIVQIPETAYLKGAILQTP
jgi:23S rRNA (cytosine1962-C5)-methyltransferase